MLGEAPVVELTSDQYFLPLLLLHSASRARLAAVFGDPGAAVLRDMDDELETGDDAEGGRVWNMMALEEALVRVLGRWLLRPVEHVRRAALAFEKQNLMSPSLQAIKRTSGAEETSKEAQGGCQVGIHVRVPMFDFELRQVLSVHAGKLHRTGYGTTWAYMQPYLQHYSKQDAHSQPQIQKLQ